MFNKVQQELEILRSWFRIGISWQQKYSLNRYAVECNESANQLLSFDEKSSEKMHESF